MASQTSRMALIKIAGTDLRSDFPGQLDPTLDLVDAAMWIFLGAWSSSAQYEINDLVTSGGLMFLAIAPNTNQHPPDVSYWVPVGASFAFAVPVDVGNADAEGVATTVARSDHVHKERTVADVNIYTANTTLSLTDAGRAVEMNSGSGVTLTVPPNSSVAFPVGTVIPEILQLGAGQVTIAAGAGVTIRSSGGLLKLTGQYSAASLRKRATNEWVLTGDLTS